MDSGPGPGTSLPAAASPCIRQAFTHSQSHTYTHGNTHRQTQIHKHAQPNTQTHLVIQTQTVTCSLTHRHTQRKKERGGKPQAASQETVDANTVRVSISHLFLLYKPQTGITHNADNGSKPHALPFPELNAWSLFGISQARPRGGT